jgi:protein-tyrosine kinase
MIRQRGVKNPESLNPIGEETEPTATDNAAVVYRIYDRHTPGAAAVFALVSARSGEGTTYCAITIAESIHHLLGDLSVLLVDANMLHGELSELVDSPQKGWLDWLGDTDRYSIQEAVVPWAGHPGVSMLPSGDRPGPEGKHRALQLFDALSGLKANFDFILIDCLSFFGDRLAPRFCTGADGTIIVIEAEKTRKSSARTMVAELRTVGSDILGAVLNKRRYHIPHWLYDRLF